MRSIPIEVSAGIRDPKRQSKAKNGLPSLTPILDSSQPSKEVIEVNDQAGIFHLLNLEKYLMT